MSDPRMYDKEAWAVLARAAGFEPIHTESSARSAFRYAAPLIEQLRNALDAANDHLNYCGWGDAWERECADAQKLPETIEAALAAVPEGLKDARFEP